MVRGRRPDLGRGTGPLARYIYMSRLLARGAARLARLLLERIRRKRAGAANRRRDQ